jgi:hypothetical protein
MNLLDKTNSSNAFSSFKPLRTFLATCMLFSSSLTAASATGLSFSFVFADAAGVGFNDIAEGADRRAAMISAGDLYSQMFGSHFSNMGNIVINATASDDPTSPTLASAGSAYVQGSGPGFNDQGVIREKLLSGTDLNGSVADGEVNVNFGNDWELDPNAAVDLTEFDFFAAVFHEFSHALGFASGIAENGEDSYGYKTDGNWAFFDQFLTDENGAPVVDPSSFNIVQDLWDSSSIGGDSPADGLFFNGPNAVAANGGNPVGIFSPTTWVQGSSGSHLDTDNPALTGLLMVHDRDFGSATRTFSAIEVGIFTDLGYTAATTAVPEPETYVLMILGLTTIYALRRKGIIQF